MRTINLGMSNLRVPVVAVGCMRLKTQTKPDAERFVKTALELGANFFDHADVYGDGLCEEMFAEAVGMNPAARERLVIQSKCGIVRGRMFDFSFGHILEAVDGSLKRLRTGYLDVLLLHRPDALVEPEEVALAFDKLAAAGKVRHFGVSNQNPMQIQLLQKYLNRPVVANQLQLSVMHAGMIAAGTHVNMKVDDAVDRDGGILDFCRLHDITVQPWSPFQYGFFEGVFLGSDKFPKLNEKIGELAAKYGVADTTIAMAWLLRHPARMQPITGTMNVGRLKDCVKAADVHLTREEWYSIYLAAGYTLP